ncbi:MAG: hypothetical protein QOF84_735 [Streptomyces sp.]|nr:hypothetical protein [Streptomyces sp.]
MDETPRLRKSAGDTLLVTPHHRYRSALAHNSAEAASLGTPRRSVGRPSQTPRDERCGDRSGRLGTLPPVPGRPTFSLTLLLLLLLLYVTLFGLLTWQEAVHGPLLALDPSLRTAVAGASVRPAGSPFGHFVADLGNPQIALPVLGLALAFAWWRGRRWRPVVAYALTMAAIPLIVTPLKAAIGRDGPGSLTLTPGYPGLYPSGHAATATLAYGAATLLVLPFVRRTAARRLLVAAAVLLNAGVGVALVYCGYHWPLDVLGSWLLCGALLTGAALAVRGIRSSSGSPG